jgi:CheY-like chemotaxis protein
MAVTLDDISVLVVDDNTFTRQIAKTLLFGFGVRFIQEAENGRVALDKASQKAPDVILLDWEMPVLGGADFLRLIRNPDHPAAYAAVIMMSSYSEISRIHEACVLGVHDYLCKPISAGLLYQHISNCLEHPRSFLRQGNYFGPMPLKSQNRGQVIGRDGRRVDEQIFI